MKRYARIEFVQAEQWSDCSKPIEGMTYYMEETIETALVETTQPIYVVHVGPNREPQQIRCSDWIVTLNDGTREVLSDTMFISMFVEADKAEKILEEIDK